MEMVDRIMKITTSEPTFLSFSELAQTIAVTRVYLDPKTNLFKLYFFQQKLLCNFLYRRISNERDYLSPKT